MPARRSAYKLCFARHNQSLNCSSPCDEARHRPDCHRVAKGFSGRKVIRSEFCVEILAHTGRNGREGCNVGGGGAEVYDAGAEGELAVDYGVGEIGLTAPPQAREQQGLKPSVCFMALAARLKSCPDTKPLRMAVAHILIHHQNWATIHFGMVRFGPTVASYLRKQLLS